MRLLAVIPFLLLSFSVFAQAEIELDKIIVTDTTVTIPLNNSSSDTTHIIKKTRITSQSAADIVQKGTGVHLLQYGGLERSTAVSIRGSASNQVQVYLDGIPLDSASSQGIGLNHIPATSLDRISIHKSSVPVTYGGSAIGGVIDISSALPDSGISQHYGLGFGSYTTIPLVAEVSRGGELMSWSFGVDYLQTAGDFDFFDNNGTPLNSSDDATVVRQNNESRLFHPHLRFEIKPSHQVSVSTTQHLFRIDSGVAGLENFQSLVADRSLTEWLGNWIIKYQNDAWMASKWEWQFYHRMIKSQFSDPNGEIGLGAIQDNDNDTLVLGQRTRLSFSPHKNLTIESLVDYSFEWFRPTDFASATPFGTTSKRHLLSFGVAPNISLFEDKTLLTVQGKSINALYDVNNDDPSLVLPGTFISKRWENQFLYDAHMTQKIASWLSLKLAGGRAVRLPQFSELFGDQGFVLGNPQLESEKSYFVSLGSVWQMPKTGMWKSLRLEGTYFQHFINDLIQFEQTSGFAQARNIGKADVYGVEFLAYLVFPKYFELSQTYTWQRAVDDALNSGNRLVGRPEHDVNTMLSFTHGRWQCSAEANYTDNQFLDALNTKKVNNRFRFDVMASVMIRDRYRLAFEGKNLTGTQIVDAVGFPLPGRSFLGRVDAYF